MKNTISLGLVLVSLVSSALAFAGPGVVLQGTKLSGQAAQGPSVGLTIAGVALVDGHLVNRR